MSNPGIPLQSAQNPQPQPDEDMLAMLGLHPAQLQVAQGLASGAIHPQQVLDAATPKPPLQAAENPAPGPTIAAPAAPRPAIAAPPDAAASRPEATLSPSAIAPPPVLSGQTATPRIAPTLAPAPDPPTSRTQADQAELDRVQRTGSGIEQFQHRHPVLGTIARIGAGVGSALFPGIAAQIPGTDIHHQVLLNQDRAAVNQDLGEQEKQALIGETGARAAHAQAEADTASQGKATKPEPIFDKAGNIVGFNTGTGLLSLKSPGLTPEMKAIADAAKPKPGPGETQEQNKIAYQGVIGKLDAKGLATDPKSIDKSLDAALKKGFITPDEHAAARSYEAANQTPGTNLTVKVAGQDESNQNAINKMFEGSEVLAHMPDGRRVQMSYADAKAQGIPPERLVKLNAKEAQDGRDKVASVQTTFKGLDRYRSDFKNLGGKLTPDDRKALEVLTSHVQTSPGFVDKLAGGIFDSLAGEPLSGYSEKFFDGLMTKDQFNAMSEPAKKLASDYATSVIDNFANMKAIMGTVGRNPQMIQAEVATLPLPYLDLQSGMIQFENKRSSLQGRAASMPEIYQPGQK